MHIQQNAPVVDFLIEMILIPYEIRHREFCQLFFDGKLHLNIALIIFFEQCPFVGVMHRKIASAATVLLGGAARLTEVFDKV